MPADGQSVSLDVNEVEARIRASLSHAPIVIFSQDRELRYTWMFNSLPGFSADALIGKRDEDVFSPNDANLLTSIKEKVIETGSGEYTEVRIVLQDQPRFFDLIVEPFRDAEGNITGITGAALDITARKVVEEERRISEERYRAVSEILFGYVYSYRVETDFKMVLEWLSGEFEQVTGFSIPEADARSGWTMAIKPEDRDIIRAKVRTLLSGREDVSEYRIFTKQGVTRWVRDFSRPVKDESGRVVRIYGAIQDITDRKAALDELRESEERFRRLSDAAVEGIVIHENGIILDANQSFAKQMGYPVEDVIGKSIDLFVAPESREIVHHHIRESSEEPYEVRALKQDGTSAVQEIAAKAFPWHGRTVRVAAIRDITRLREAEVALRESEGRFRSIFMNDVSGNYLAAADGRIILCNPAFAKMFGFGSPEEATEHRIQEIFLAPEEWDTFIAELREVKRRENYERDRRRLDGRVIRILGTSVARYDEQGEFVEFAGYVTDITDRKLAEEAARLNADRMESLLKLNQMTERPLAEITEFALEETVRLTRSKIGYLAFLDEAEEVATMYAWSKEAMRECAIQGPPIQYVVENMGLWGEAIRQRKPIVTNDYTASNPLKKGYPEGHIPILRHMNAPVISGGRIVLVAGVGNKEEAYDESDIQQVTLLMEGMWRLIERKRTLDALRAEEEKVRTILENSLDAAYRRDIEAGKCDYVSRAIERITGFTSTEFCAMTDEQIGEYVHPYDLGPMREELAAVARGERDMGILEYRFRAKNGEYRWLADNFTVIRDGKNVPRYRVGVVHDITGQRMVEESLRESEARFRTLAEASSEGLLIYEKEAVLDANRRFSELFRYGIGEPAGMYLGEFFPEEYREQALRALRDSNGQPYETVGERKDGVQIPLEISGRSIPWYGRMVQVAALRDISPRKEMERNIARLRREYESFMRHELKNLFVPIQMHASILLENAEERFTPEERVSLRRIRESAQRAAGVIDALKRIQDLEEGRYTLRLIRCSVRKMIREVVRDLRPVADTSGVTLLFTVRGGRTEVFADHDLMPGVFSNLILNAIEHVAESGDMEEKIVRITVHAEQGGVMVKINNRGEPISPERLETFFEKFNVGPEKRGGLGLGTTYAWLVTKAHGGDIRVTSTLWEGTTVSVILRPAGKAVHHE